MHFRKIIGIAASDPQGVIGKNGKLPWHCPEDLRHFAETIHNQAICMGHRTFLSLPRHYFEKQTAIVFTRQSRALETTPELTYVSCLNDFFNSLSSIPLEKEIYVIGGAEIYTLFFDHNLFSEFILTTLKSSYEGDAFFPLRMLFNWPRLTIRDEKDFSISRYFNPHPLKNAKIDDLKTD